MVPAKSHPRYRQLVTGEVTFQFKAFAIGMCVSRNVREVEKAGKSQAAIQAAIEDVHAFLEKYENILQEDISSIFE